MDEKLTEKGNHSRADSGVLRRSVCMRRTERAGRGGKADGKPDGKAADAGEIGKKLAEDLAFEDELTLADEDMAGMLYGIDAAVQSSVYISSGATAEEIAVFEFETEEDCKEAVSLAEQRIEDQKEAFASYVPKEVKRLDGAVVKQYGRFLAVCVCDDGRKAEELLAELFQ